ncbi:MAG: sulfatase-like hydrolase/transferase, partial [Chitinophagaceae bacterium]|nr:sulfatase-like hydrolase/transferase [Chitinophagaceae bacterium]
MKRLYFFFLLFSFAANAQRTNIIYIMSDDHDADAISAYNKKFIKTPHIDRLAREGMIFTNAFVGNSICSPARATLLTGQHSHKNAVKDNRTAFDTSKITLPKILNEAGYQTAIVGKWHLHSYPSHFSHWKVLPGQGLYHNPRFVTMQHDTVVVKGYATDVITDEALAWMNGRDVTKPFMLLVHHKAPHRNWMPTASFLRQTIRKFYPEPPTLFADMNNHGKAWQGQKMTILYDMLLASDLKIDPQYLSDIPDLKPSQNDVAVYNSSFA